LQRGGLSESLDWCQVKLYNKRYWRSKHYTRQAMGFLDQILQNLRGKRFHLWQTYGHEVPNMRDLAIKILSLTCRASGCERNWSIFEYILTKKRNRLDHEMIESLVFKKYNQQLIERYNLKDEVDPIALNDIDECNEWLVGEIGTATFRDDDNVDDDANLVHQDDNTLSWNLVFEAMG
ncbi:hypothetical protein S83_035317, partial [Arachis hypogaea]